MQKLKDFKIKPKKSPFNYIFWLISTSRNALVVIICSTIAYCYETNATNSSPFLLTGKVKGGLPEIKLPPFNTTLNNRTIEFNEMIADLGTSVVLVPIIAVLGNVAIAKAFCKQFFIINRIICKINELLFQQVAK